MRLAEIKKEVIDDDNGGGQANFQSSTTTTPSNQTSKAAATGNHYGEAGLGPANGRVKRQASQEVEYALPHSRKVISHSTSMVLPSLHYCFDAPLSLAI